MRPHNMTAMPLAVLLWLACFLPLAPAQTQSPTLPPPAEQASPTGSSATTPTASTPATQPVLALMPDSAMVGLALPPVSGLYKTIQLLAGRYFSALAAEIFSQACMEEWANAAGTPGAETPGDILRAFGVDPDAPAGLFLDYTPASENARKALENLRSGMVWKEKNHPVCPNGDGGWFAPDVANFVVVVGVSDPALAETSAKLVITAAIGTSSCKNIAWADGTICDYGPLAYCLVDGKLFLADDIPMLRESLARLKDPDPARDEALGGPAAQPDAFVLYTRIGKLAAIKPDILPWLESAFPKEIIDPAVLGKALRYPEGLFLGEGPVVTTLTIGGDKVELLSRLPLSGRANYLKCMGTPPPLHLARLLPEDTRVFCAFHLTPEVKNLIANRVLVLFATFDPSRYKTAMDMLDMLKDEIVLGVLPAQRGTQDLVLLAELAKPDAARALLRSVPEVSLEEGAPASMNARIEDNCLVISTTSQTASAFADAVAQKKNTRLLEVQDPPVDSVAPTYGLMLIRMDSLPPSPSSKSLIAGLPERFGRDLGINILSALQGVQDQLSAVFRECRAGKLLNGDSQELFVRLYFK